VQPLPRSLTDDVADLAARGYLAGRGWMLWREHPGLGGMVLWGPQSEEQAQAIIRVCSRGLGSLSMLDPTIPFVALLDLRRAGAINLSAFSVFHEWLVDVNLQHPDLRVVILGDPSPASAAMLGLVQISAPRIIHALGKELEPILVQAKAPKGLLRSLDATVESLMAPSIAESLRAVLLESHAQISVQKAARALSMSARSLQRALEKDGTTFERERAAAKREIYERLVADPSLKIDAVASSLGFGSLRAFSTAFRRAVGVSPREFRRSLRAPPADRKTR
jgi:AraC-like DNA-binding protein